MHLSLWPRRALRALAMTALGVGVAIPLGTGVASAALPLAITTTTVPTATVGHAYTASLSATGGNVPYSWTLSAGSLCPGLHLNSGTPNASITGTPTASGNYSFTVRLQDSGSPTPQVTTMAYAIDCQAAGLSITTASLPAATQGIGYGAAVHASGGTPPYTWTAAGLPTGLSIGLMSGTITGVPTSTGNACATITAVDASVPALSASRVLCINVTSGLAVATTTLPVAVVNVAYVGADLSASGGTGPYTWALISGALPPGMTLTAAGHIGGTPLAVGTFPFGVKVTDSTLPTPETATATLSLVVAPTGLSLTGGAPDGVLDVGYSKVFTATGGTAPYSYSISNGSLPPGLALDPITGQISGTPTTAGFFPFTISAHDSSVPSKMASDPTSITINPPLSIVTLALPDATEGQGYNQQLLATGGEQPYTWTVVAGFMPFGLYLNANTGQIVGHPHISGTFNFKVMVTDSAHPAQTAFESYVLKVNHGLVVNTAFPDGVVGSGYSVMAATTGGTAPYGWAVTNGSLPPGLALNPATGQIAGTPTTPGYYPFSLTVSDSSTPGLTTVVSTSITIESVLTSLTTSMPDGTVGIGYSQMVTAGNGLPPYHFAVSSGGLPNGLGLTATTGAITGTPTVSGQFGFTVEVNDSSTPAQALFIPLTITIHPKLTFVCGALANGTVGTPYAQALTATGGTKPYTWVQISGSMPPGLALTPSTGVISGVPTAAGFYTVNIAVADSSTPIGNTSATCTIAISGTLAITSTTPLPVAGVGAPYSTTLTAAGGLPPYSWMLVTGALPPGLMLTPGGTIVGAPTVPGTFIFNVRVTDSAGHTSAGTFSIRVVPLPLANATGPTLPNGTVGTLYTVPQAVTGGTKPYAYGISTGSLPPGLSIDASTGVISGTPTTAGTKCFTVQVSDSSTPVQTVFDSECISITTGLAITTTTLPTATHGVGYSGTVMSAGGVAPVTYTLTGGALPPGLALNSGTGAITGTPTTPGLYFFVITATDASSPTHETASQLLFIQVV